MISVKALLVGLLGAVVLAGLVWLGFDYVNVRKQNHDLWVYMTATVGKTTGKDGKEINIGRAQMIQILEQERMSKKADPKVDAPVELPKPKK